MIRRVKLVKRKGRKFIQMEWQTEDGEIKTESTKKTTEVAARKVADLKEDEINSGSYSDEHTPWDQFVEEYQDEELSNKSKGTLINYSGTLRLFKQLVNPSTVQSVSSKSIRKFKQKLTERTTVKSFKGKREEVLVSDATVNRHLRQLGAALKWAYKVELIQKLPRFSMMPKQARVPRLGQ